MRPGEFPSLTANSFVDEPLGDDSETPLVLGVFLRTARTRVRGLPAGLVRRNASIHVQSRTSIPSHQVCQCEIDKEMQHGTQNEKPGSYANFSVEAGIFGQHGAVSGYNNRG